MMAEGPLYGRSGEEAPGRSPSGRGWQHGSRLRRALDARCQQACQVETPPRQSLSRRQRGSWCSLAVVMALTAWLATRPVVSAQPIPLPETPLPETPLPETAVLPQAQVPVLVPMARDGTASAEPPLPSVDLGPQPRLEWFRSSAGVSPAAGTSSSEHAIVTPRQRPTPQRDGGRIRWTTLDSNVRAAPSKTARIVTVMRRGSRVETVGGKVNHGWYQVARDGKVLGYVAGFLLSSRSPGESGRPPLPRHPPPGHR